MLKRKGTICAGLVTEISGSNENYFLTTKEIESSIYAFNNINVTASRDINLSNLEKQLKKNLWIDSVELFFDNNNFLHIAVAQRQPIARLFTVNGTSAFVDKNGLRLPLKAGATQRVLAISGFPSSNDILAKTDSNLLQNSIYLANIIVADTFLNAQIAELNINTKGQFELLPAVGNHSIIFGDTTNASIKFKKLITFYKQAWLKTGTDIYERIDLRFKNQVVASKKNSMSIKSIDSTAQIIDTTINIFH